MKTIELPASRVNPVYRPHYFDTHRTQIYYGGSASGKSWFLASRAVLDALQGRNILIVRKVARTLRGSCWNEVTKAIGEMDLGKLFTVNKSDMLVTANNNGCQLVFAGLDDVEKIKSITPAKGVFTDIWMEEATEATYGDYKQLDKRLRGASRHPKRFTLSFNPVYKTHWIYKEFFAGFWDDAQTAAETDSLSILKTTHRDNRFLAPEDHDALENEQDAYFRAVYTDGDWGVLGDVIFTNWHAEDLGGYADDGRLYTGLDFGFSSDPAAAVRVRYERAKKRVLVLDELYGRGMVNAELADRLKAFAPHAVVTCDSAEPKSIEELRRCGIQAVPCKKGPDSVIHGIQWLQGHEIVVDRHCQNLINELTLYQWRKDRDGNSLAQPVDRDNHLIDALRYALDAEITLRRATTRSDIV